MSWQQFVLDLNDLDADQVEVVFERHGAQSVTLTDAGDQPVLEPAPGEAPLWGETRITGLFAVETDLDALAADLLATLLIDTLPPHRVHALADRAWELEWAKDFGPMPFGKRLWVCPGDSEAPGGAIVVRLDPGLAFGTGTHPTTAMCLEWLERIELDGKTVLDYGSGSGVLAIAALKLGAASAVAMDIDPQAVTATRNNAAHNAVADRLAVLARDADITGTFDVVVANILAGPLVERVESITTRLSSAGELALSGILSDQVDTVVAAYAPQIDFEAPAYRAQGGQTWARLSGTRRVS